MKSIKPGRGPALLMAIMGIFVTLFGVAWTAFAAKMAPMMAFFGLFFIGIAVTITVFGFKNAFGKNRISMVDIVETESEKDTADIRVEIKTSADEKKKEVEAEACAADGKNVERAAQAPIKTSNKFCPYCGVSVQEGYKFCNACGKKLP